MASLLAVVTIVISLLPYGELVHPQYDSGSTGLHFIDPVLRTSFMVLTRPVFVT